MFVLKLLPKIRKLFATDVCLTQDCMAFRFCSQQFDKELSTELKIEIENKWKSSVNLCDNYNEKSTKKKFYVLSMFPYPSGNLHMGHLRVYAISDAISRFYRLKGYNVLQPIGFDAFGLPAENAARDRNIPPEVWTEKNIAVMREQLVQLGFSFDWDREVITCSPEYYKFTQYLFLLLYKEGLVYREEAIVNWDPIDKTVLADEQVDSQGRSWRSGVLVEKKVLKQWFIKTTHFAHSLLSGLDNQHLHDWKDVISLQQHWIGKCDGASFVFKLFDKSGLPQGQIDIWVKYPEMIPNAAFVTVSTNSMMGRKLRENNLQLEAKCPFSMKLFPVLVSDDLDFPEGCDHRLGIPLYSEEDTNFADQNGIIYSKESRPCVNFEERTRLCSIALKSRLGGVVKSSKLRDWLISRQRQWGTPIPVLHCVGCGEIPLSFDDLPVYLPRRGESLPPVFCPKCGREATRETDTMDTFVDSAWYFLRYADPHNQEKPFCERKVDNLLPVDVYVGGKEHAVLHLYYARFICHFLYSIGMLTFSEPFKRLLVQGMVTGKTYCVKDSGKFLKKEEVLVNKSGFLTEASSGKEVVVTWEKMSKSRYNGVEPSEVLQMYGIDTTKLLMLASVTPTSQRRWSDETFAGVLNWQKKLWVLMNLFLEIRNKGSKGSTTSEEEYRIYDARNYSISGITFHFASSHQLSVAISKMQSLTNSIRKSSEVAICNSLEFERALAALIIMLSPIAPYFCSELWSGFRSAPGRLDLKGQFIDWNKPLFEQSWPTLDGCYKLPLICKVNNSIKAIAKLPFQQLKSFNKTNAFELALKQDNVHSFLNGCDIINYEYEWTDSHGAVINMIINPLQRRKISQALHD